MGHPCQDPEAVFGDLVERRGVAIVRVRGTQAEAVADRRAQPGHQRQAESAEALLTRQGDIPMVAELRYLPLAGCVRRQPFSVADVMVRTYEKHGVGRARKARTA
jgi:hypothetical protein